MTLSRQEFIDALDADLSKAVAGEVVTPTPEMWCWSASLMDKYPETVFRTDLSMPLDGELFKLAPCVE